MAAVAGVALVTKIQADLRRLQGSLWVRLIGGDVNLKRKTGIIGIYSNTKTADFDSRKLH